MSPRKKRKTPAERAREYRTRKKARENPANPEPSCPTSIDVQVEVHQENSVSDPPRKSKTPAERSREYRARKKALENSAISEPTCSTSIDVQVEVHQEHSVSDPPRKSKTPAERSRQYRARKKSTMVLKNSVLNAPSTETFSTDNPCTGDQEGAILSEADFIIRDIPNTTTTPSINNVTKGFQTNDLRVLYSTFYHHKKAHEEFKTKFINNPFGHICSICDRLWFKRDLKSASNQHQQILNTIVPLTSIEKIALCTTCFTSLNKDNIPMMSVYNGFKYPKIPDHLPPLDILSERLISPCLSFMQIRRLRHVNGQYGILGQVINVPVCVNTMMKSLPRNVDDDYCINVHIKRKKNS